MKSYTDLEQSKKLAEILPLESADMRFCFSHNLGGRVIGHYPMIGREPSMGTIPCWSLAALLSLIKDKCGYFEFVYLKRTYDGRANPLDDVYRLSTDVYDVYNKEAVDACCEMLVKLYKLNLL